MLLARFFAFEDHQTTLRTEVTAGVTTFMTMCYILVVNPQILSQAGMPFDGVLFATSICSAIATLVMGLYARYPIALAPGMGLNAYFALVVAPQLAQGSSQTEGWETALGAVFISGLLFLVLTFLRIRETIVNTIPEALKLAISGGIGLFIALIGFKNGGLVQHHPATLITLGDLHAPAPILTIGGLLLTGALLARGVKGSILYGMVAVALAALPLGVASLPDRVVAFPQPMGTLMKLDPLQALRTAPLHVIFAFFFVDFFDTVGTLIGIAEQGGFLDEHGRLPRASRALFADALGTVLGSLLGTSTVTSYIESATGIAAGGRTGLTATVTALLFLLAAFLSPLLRAVPAVAAAPALIVVGALMVGNVRKIAWNDASEALPAFLTLVGIVFTFSIADGMALGFVSYAAIKALAGCRRDVSATNWVLAALFILRYALL